MPPPAERVIHSLDDVAEGAAWLAARDPRLAAALAECPDLPLRRAGDGFAALQRAILGQQVSVASARAIEARCVEAGLTDPARVRAASDDDMRAAGLSRQKIRYIRALAEADLDWPALRAMPTDEVVRTLTAIPGIGTWTAEIYAMFNLGRADVFAPGDLALQEAARLLLDLPHRPKEREMREIAEQWSPWRGVAARLLWAYYRVAKDRDGI
ncbi:DNA-3-methyladenine glycosylase 2 family protein [Jannaschia sp. Os4]|uniref:DNA-3-methyladenine glycosylase family protein n=1 Tax=Jannaschia sp. Os4 TaxID=2807617 RepID=UPI001939B297|nr:DNA-3-methyladenine glycosylase 2 family protein [Jannaschia sp. Os4]MBM2576425.1 DNA-3-methyladenine glycosylase 2 family protein [Jannaschia sp. Os4]